MCSTLHTFQQKETRWKLVGVVQGSWATFLVNVKVTMMCLQSIAIICIYKYVNQMQLKSNE